MDGRRLAAPAVALVLLQLLQLLAVVPQGVRSAVPPPVRYEVPMPFTSNDTVMEGRRTTTVASDEWSGPLSTPVAANTELPHNKFSSRPAIELESIVFGTDATKLQRKSKCPIDLELVWAHPLEQGVYATPIVHQLLSGGSGSAHVPGGGASKQLIVPTFHQHMVMLAGDGHAIPEFGFSAADGSYFHTSPVMLDFDGDGVLDIVWTSVNAEVFVISGDPAAAGKLLIKPFFLPKLRVRKRWHEGVDAVPYTEFQHTAAQAAAHDPSHPNNLPHIKASATPLPDTHVDAVLVDSHEDLPGGGGSKLDAPAHEVPDTHANLLPAHMLKAQPDMPQHMAEPKAPVPLPPGGAAVAAGARHLLSVQGDGGAGDGGDDALAQVGDGLTEEGRESLKLFSEDGVAEGAHRGDAHSDDHDGDGEADAHAFVDPFDHRVYPLEPDFVWVDAHVLATPAVADVDRDGFPDVVFSVSYFYDEEDFTNHPHLFTHLGTDVNIHKYVAGGIVAWNLRKGNVIWSEHLDLTTDETELRAYIYSSPTVVDLDGDGGLEIIVGTSLGFIYAMHADNGHLLTGFPLSMSEIQAQVAVEDVNGDGHLELIALDNKGNVLCFDRTGKEIWERRTSGFTAQGATFGDVNGDMILDVVVGTVTGHVWALSGTDGSVVPHFPVKTEGRIIAPITLVNLDRPQPGVIAKKGLHLVFPSFDGHVYIVDGRTGCTNKVDIGEHAYGMVLVDDVLGNGHLDLLVSTMNGNVFLFGTTVPYHPLNTWTAQTQHLNGFTARNNFHGIYVDLHSREHRDVLGRDVVVDFTIVDHRPQRGADHPPRRYDVNMTVGNELLLSKSYTAPGQYREVLRALSVPAYATVQVHMTNEHAQYFYDSFSLGFNVAFYRPLKWLLALPFAAMAAVLVYVKSLKQTALPT